MNINQIFPLIRLMGLGKARKAAAEPWKLRLYETPIDDFATAQQLMDVIVDITGQKPGKFGGKIQPRICTSCRRWGHTSEHCAYWSHLYENKVGPPPNPTPMQVRDAGYTPITREECTEIQWRWVCEFKRLMDRCDKAHEQECQYSPNWRPFCEAYDIEHPQYPAGNPYNLI